jgi:glutathione S-transferase
MADSKQLVVLHPAPVSPVLLQLVLSFASDQDRQKVKLQGVGARNCPVLVLKVNPTSGDCLYGEEAAVQYFARIFNLKSLLSLGDPFQEVEVIQWLSYVRGIKSSSSPKSWLQVLIYDGRDSLNNSFPVLFQELNTHLSLRSVFVGYHLTLADLAVWTAIFLNEEARSLINESNYPHLARFLRYCSSFPQISQGLMNGVFLFFSTFLLTWLHS